MQAVENIEGGEKAIRRCVCSECKGKLNLAWGGSYGIDSHVIRCADNPYHTGIERPARIPLSALGLPFISTPKERREEMAEEHGKSAMTKLAIYEQKGLLTQQEAETICLTLWEKAPQDIRTQASMICVQYGLNPLMRHLFLIPYWNKKTEQFDWSIVLAINATRIIASGGMAYSYLDGYPKIMTPDEQKAIYGKVQAGKVMAVCKVRRMDGMVSVGYGNYPANEQPKGVEKGNSQENMAMIRAERQCLDRAAPGALPKNVGVIDETYADTITGEIVEGEAQELPEDPALRSIPFDGKYGPIQVTCPEHEVEWYTDKYGKLVHKQDDDFCHLRDILKGIMAEVLAKHGMVEDGLNSITKNKFGDTYSRIAELDLITVLDELWHQESQVVEPTQHEEEVRTVPSLEQFQPLADEFIKKLKWNEHTVTEWYKRNFPGCTKAEDLSPEQREKALHLLADFLSMKE